MAQRLRHLRSNQPETRPSAVDMAAGQLAVNYAKLSPALFFKNSTDEIVKVGPIHVGLYAPNSTPSGSVGNSVGEGWLDTSIAKPVFKIWDGSVWVAAGNGGSGGGNGGDGENGGTASVWVGDEPPVGPSYQGDFWWQSDEGELFIYYDDGDTKQWVQASGASSGIQGEKVKQALREFLAKMVGKVLKDRKVHKGQQVQQDLLEVL